MMSSKFRPTAEHARPVACSPPPDLGPGQERRWLAARPRESRDEALARARRTMPWGKDAIGAPTFTRGRWTFTVNVRAA